MMIYPAIDLLDGQCVRLHQGDYNQVTVYHPDALALAAEFKNAGATWLHVVDLGAARQGNATAADMIHRLASESGLRVQTGGGIRDEKRAAELLEAQGVSRIIIGTAAVKDPELVATLVNRYGSDRIAVGIDAKNGEVRTHGWNEGSGIKTEVLVERMADQGATNIIFTDIARDGTLTGPALEKSQALIEQFPGLSLICSGGISNLDDIRACRAIGAAGVIVGKAIYEKKIALADLFPGAGA